MKFLHLIVIKVQFLAFDVENVFSAGEHKARSLKLHSYIYNFPLLPFSADIKATSGRALIHLC